MNGDPLMYRNWARRAFGWVLAIAAFTFLNTALALIDADVRMLIGLVSAQLLMAFHTVATGFWVQELTLIGAFAVAVVFFVLWYLMYKGRRWPLWPVVILYSLDTVLCVVLADWIGLTFHVLALVYMIMGLVGLRRFEGPLTIESAAKSPSSPQDLAPAAWLPDPLGRHELRYWDAKAWTEHVSDAGMVGSDPIAAVS